MGCGVSKIHLLMRRSQEKHTICVADPCDRLHVPDMVLIRVNLAFRGKNVKRRKAEIFERVYRPAIIAISGYILFGHVESRCRYFSNHWSQIADWQLRPFPAQQWRQGRALRGCRSSRSVLLSQQFLCLGRPRHQFAVEADP